jgi:hypothetical protein
MGGEGDDLFRLSFSKDSWSVGADGVGSATETSHMRLKSRMTSPATYTSQPDP